MSNLYESITKSDRIESLKETILSELKGQDLDEGAIVNALVASTSMGFNSLFDTLSKMTANGYVLSSALEEVDVDNIDPQLIEVAKDTVALIKAIGTAIENDKVEVMTNNLRAIMEKQLAKENVEDESTTDSQGD